MILGDWGRAVSISLFLKFYFKGTRSFIFRVKSAAFPFFGYDCSSFTLVQKDQDHILCSLAGENQQSAAARALGKWRQTSTAYFTMSLSTNHLNLLDKWKWMRACGQVHSQKTLRWRLKETVQEDPGFHLWLRHRWCPFSPRLRSEKMSDAAHIHSHQGHPLRATLPWSLLFSSLGPWISEMERQTETGRGREDTILPYLPLPILRFDKN